MTSDQVVQVVAAAQPRCSFHERTLAEESDLWEPLWHYRPVSINGPAGQSPHLVTPYVPREDELIFLWDHVLKEGGAYRVVDVFWRHSQYGSVDWPAHLPGPVVGPMVDIIVEKAEGPFQREAPGPASDGAP